MYRYVVESRCGGANCTYSWNRRLMCPYPRGVVPPGGAGVAMAPPLERSVNPISIGGGGGRLCPPNNTGTPGFSDLPTALYYILKWNLSFPGGKEDIAPRTRAGGENN